MSESAGTSTPRGPASLSIVYSFPHAIGQPGIGMTAWNQVSQLVADGHDVTLVTASVARPIAGLSSVTQTMSIANRRVPHRLIGRDRAFALHDFIAGRVIKKVDPDVVHAWPLSSRRALSQAARQNIPGMREVPNTHTANAFEVVEREYVKLGLQMPARASHTVNQRHLETEEAEWAAASGLLVPSDAVARSFLERGFSPDRLFRHRYGFNPEDANAAPRPQSVTSTASRNSRPFTVLFMGRCEPRKGLHYALEAWHASEARKSGRFIICGAFVPAYRDYLSDLLSHPSVEVRGFVDNVAELYDEADVMVLPTIEEGSALVTYEAQAQGCVLLVSTAAGADFSEGVEGFSHAPGDVGVLRDQLDRLSSDATLLTRMQRSAREHGPDLTWEAANKELTKCYARAISEIALRNTGARVNR